MFRPTSYSIGMRVLLPMDISVPVRERWLIGTGVILLHLLLVAPVLRVAGHVLLGVDDQIRGEASALSVTFVTLTPLTPSARMPVVPPPLLAPE